MAKKTARPTRRELREEKKREKEEAAEAGRAAVALRNRWLVLISLASAGAALGVYQLGLSVSLIGLVLLAGAGLLLTVALGGLGGSVAPRDRGKSGNIDFGS